MRVLITGATGFIGGHLVEACLERGDQVTCLVRKSSDISWLQEQNVQILPVDFSSIDALQEAVEGVDVAFHLAASIYAPTWDRYYEANCQTTENLLEACERSNSTLRRFVFVSSISATGPGKKGDVLNEEAPCDPVSDYGRSKLAAEEIVLARQAQLPVVIIRPTNIIGPRQSELLSSIRLIRRRIVPSIGNGEKQTSLCYITDLIAALLLAAEKEAAIGKTYFVAGSGTYGWGELTEIIKEVLGISGLCLKVPYAVQYAVALLSEWFAFIGKGPPMLSRENLAASRDYYWIYDESKIRTELGFLPVIGIKEGIAQTIVWYKQNGIIS